MCSYFSVEKKGGAGSGGEKESPTTQQKCQLFLTRAARFLRLSCLMPGPGPGAGWVAEQKGQPPRAARGTLQFSPIPPCLSKEQQKADGTREDKHPVKGQQVHRR